LIYFIKARRGHGAAGEPAFAFAWAERLRPSEGRLAAENIQVPVVAGGPGAWRLVGRRLPDQSFDGRGFPCGPPKWYAPDAPAAPASAGASRLEERLRTTPLGRMCLHPEVRRALAQDRLASSLEPLLRVPDLLDGEDELAAAWRRERPEAAAQADAGAAALAPSASGAAGVWRRRLRLAALRRLDAAAVGREVYRPCPAYFGEPYLACAIAPDLSLKAGLVRRMAAWPTPESEARSRAWRADGARVAAVEGRLLPVLAPAADSALDRWLALAPLREFEARSPWPLFPPATGGPAGPVPAGFRVRIRPETVRELGGTGRTLALAGLSPYLAEPFGDYCETQRELLAAWAQDPAGLALAKWGGG
jgi:hypothetical protein